MVIGILNMLGQEFILLGSFVKYMHGCVAVPGRKQT